jgi:hypothetical protein
MIEPSFPALFSNPSRQRIGHGGPFDFADPTHVLNQF